MSFLKRTGVWTARAFLLGAAALAGFHLVTRAQAPLNRGALGIQDSDAGDCAVPTLQQYPPGQYNQQRAANDFLLYAIAALNVYEDENITRFVVRHFDERWEQKRSYERNGLHYAVYYKQGDPFEVLVALRGTRLDSLDDLKANFSWFTGGVLSNEYDLARSEFQSIRLEAIKAAQGRKIRFVTTGHSLGGGIAYHLAYGFPCVSAVGFDTSPVWNVFRYDNPFTPISINLHDRLDWLTRISRLPFPEHDSNSHRWYPLDLQYSGFKHSITKFAVGMAGMVTNCQNAKGCKIPLADDSARKLYCPTYGHQDGLAICEPYIAR